MRIYSFRICTVFVLLLSLPFISYTQPQAIQWQKALGTTRNDNGSAIIKAKDGGFLVLGNVTWLDGDVTDFRNFQSNAWVAKLSKTGVKEWTRCLAANIDANSRVKGVATPDGGFLVTFTVSHFDSTGWSFKGGNFDIGVMKLNADGTTEWQKSYGGSDNDEAASIEATYDGNYLLLGSTGSNDKDVSGNHGQIDNWVFKIDPVGNLLWQQCYGNTQTDYAKNGRAVPTRDGGFLLVGCILIGDGDDGYIVKVNNAGTTQWSKMLIGEVNEDPRGAVELSNGNFLVMVPTASTSISPMFGAGEIWLVELNSLGDIVWQQTYGGSSTDWGSKIFADTDGGFILSGWTSSTNGYLTGVPGTSTSHSQAWLLKINPAHAIVWQKVYGGSADDRIDDVIPAGDGELAFVGTTFSNNGDVSGNHAINTSDIWVVKTGAFNTIKGIVYVDANANGVKDPGETGVSNFLIKSEKPGSSWQTTTSNGLFDHRVDSGNFTTSIVLPSPYFISVPASYPSNFPGALATDSFSFAIQPIPGKQDYAISLSALTPIRPGFNTTYRLTYFNNGTETLTNKTIRLVKNNKTSFVSGSPAPTINADTLTWTIASLAAQDSGHISVVIKTEQPPAVNIGDTVSFVAVIDSIGDQTTLDNVASFRQRATGSYDPNDKRVSLGDFISTKEVLDQKHLTYTIRFQNTGNDTAFSIIVRDTLDTKLDLSSFEMVAASHPYKLNIKNGRYVAWNFADIMLLDSVHNEPLSHGYISYRIKPKSNLVLGDMIDNRASIYFDFNLPVATNVQRTTVMQLFALPAQLGKFIAYKKRDQSVQVEWQTITEVNADRFEIERSTNGLDFIVIGKQSSKKQFTGASYALIDKTPFAGTNYYRLKTVDIDGKFSYSDVVIVKLDKSEFFVSNIYPNPVRNQFMLELKGVIKGNAEYAVYSLNGQQVLQRNLGKLDADSYLAPVDIRKIPAGIYILQVQVGSSIHRKKLVIE